MITAGVDLATEPRGTALAVIDWSPRGATLLSLDLGVDDALILRTAASVDKLGIDCPLGWPDDFVRFITAHHYGHVTTPLDIAGLAWRRRLAYRETDRVVQQRTGITPLSVAADRIGLTAMRAAGLLARLAEQGQPVDRSGTGILVEVYPAASLKCWQLTSRGYKGTRNRDQLALLVAATSSAAPWLRVGEQHAALCGAEDDAFDAVIAALTARAAALSQITEPADQPTRALAQTEGWIALPSRALDCLITS